jgi:hypothetical protein
MPVSSASIGGMAAKLPSSDISPANTRSGLSAWTIDARIFA